MEAAFVFRKFDIHAKMRFVRLAPSIPDFRDNLNGMRRRNARGSLDSGIKILWAFSIRIVVQIWVTAEQYLFLGATPTSRPVE